MPRPRAARLPVVLSPHVIELGIRDPYAIWVRFDDGVSGEVDLSDSAETGGIFAAWHEDEFWRSAHIVPETGAVAWGEDDSVDICPVSLYLDVTGQSFGDLHGDAAVLAGS